MINEANGFIEILFFHEKEQLSVVIDMGKSISFFFPADTSLNKGKGKKTTSLVGEERSKKPIREGEKILGS